MSPPLQFSGYQKSVVGMLAFLQFAVILDFMLMSPLGAMIMSARAISPKQFGLVVSACAFSAGASGLLTAGLRRSFRWQEVALVFSIVMVLIYTHLPPIELPYFVVVNAVLFVGIFSRIIPFQALVSSVPQRISAAHSTPSAHPSSSCPADLRRSSPATSSRSAPTTSSSTSTSSATSWSAHHSSRCRLRGCCSAIPRGEP
jgi:hypothetical protein